MEKRVKLPEIAHAVVARDTERARTQMAPYIPASFGWNRSLHAPSLARTPSPPCKVPRASAFDQDAGGNERDGYDGAVRRQAQLARRRLRAPPVSRDR